jgi:hypothetical protein
MNNTEYMRIWRKNNPDKVKEITKRSNERSKKNGLQKKWRAENPDKIRGYEKAYAEKYPEKMLAKHRRKNLRRFGLTPEQYDAMLLSQGGVCAICNMNRDARRLAVDHDHKTGKVRSLLCHFCNTALGKFLDDVEILKKAILYLEKFRLEE